MKAQTTNDPTPQPAEPDHSSSPAAQTRTVQADRILAPQTRWSAGFDALAVFLVWASPVLVHFMPQFAGEDPLAEPIDASMYLGVAVHATLAIALIALVLHRRGHSWRSVGWTCSSVWRDALTACAALAFIFAIHLLIMVTISIVSPDTIRQLVPERTKVTQVFAPISSAMIVPFSLLVGFYEETLFRGFLMTRLKRWCGSWVAAVLLVSASFALIHYYQDWVARLQIFAISLVFSAVFIWRGSIVSAGLAHAAFNAGMLLAVKYYSVLEQRLHDTMQPMAETITALTTITFG